MVKFQFNNHKNIFRQLKSPTIVNPMFKKGNFFKRNKSTYIILEIEENDEGIKIGYCLRIKNRFNRFDINHKTICNKMTPNLFSIENFSIDDRDLEIAREFISLVNETNFKIIKGYHFFNIYENLSKFKKYLK